MTKTYRTIIIGAGAAGMHCAAYCQASGATLVIDHAGAPGEKIRISGGGRCNFTNIHTGPENFLSQNPHFAKSALARYTPDDFTLLVQRHQIAFHEKTLGQLFCDTSAKDIIALLRAEMAGCELLLETSVARVEKHEDQFHLTLPDSTNVVCTHLVIASGGKSIPKMGATGFGYQIAQQFNIPIIETRPGLVPLTFNEQDLALMRPLSGLSLDAVVRCGDARFREALLFTHRGLSGPSILQISSYWRPGLPIAINLIPDQDAFDWLHAMRRVSPRQNFATLLAGLMPKRLAQALADRWQLGGNIADYSDVKLRTLADQLHNWKLMPTGTEGYRTAEVTIGGVSTAALNARTMESKTIRGLYFIGEVVDVTGWLGGYNFQWAWASAHAAGRAISDA